MSNILFTGLFVLALLAQPVVCVFGWIRRENRELDPIRIYMSLLVITSLFDVAIPHNDSFKTIFYIQFNLFSVVQVLIVYYYLYRRLQSALLRKWLVFLLAVISALIIFFFLSPDFGITHFLTSFYGLANLFITIPCIFYFYELFRADEGTDLQTNPHFYVACGFLFYFSTTFPFFISYKKLYDITPEIYHILIGVQSALEIILYLIFVKAFLCPQPEEKLFS